MRFPVDAGLRILVPLVVVILGAAVSGCGMVGNADRMTPLTVAPLATTGPAADYPMVLGDPFTVDGEVFTPADTLNYDAVGSAGIDDGAGVTAAHRTLPLPSYAEVTSLDSGKTILLRIERRGPMTGNRLVSLSPAAAAQLGIGEGGAVRLRRVNPPEAERAELRAGNSVAERIETPKSLVEVLRRKLPANGVANLGKPSPMVPTAPVSASRTAMAQAQARAVVEPPVAASPVPIQTAPAKASVIAATPPPAAAGNLVVQAAAFASRANADRAAKSLGGSVTSQGRFFLVRIGPFTTRAQADVALAKARAAGYSDARVTTAG